MDNFLIFIFTQQIITQTQVALHGRALMRSPQAAVNGPELWIGAQLFLMGSGNVAKALWGAGRTKPTTTTERVALRHVLGVKDGAALDDVRLRNKYEHFDAAIDTWWSTSSTKNFMDQIAISPKTVKGLEPVDMFRMYDRRTDTLFFWGEEFPVVPIERELRNILAKASKIANGPGRTEV